MQKSKEIIYHFFGSNNTIARDIQSRLLGMRCVFHNRLDIEEMLLNNSINQLNVDINYTHKVIYSWGVLYSARLLNQTYLEACQSYVWNFLIPMKILEIFNQVDIEFQLIYISSESARKGSFDGNYAAQKAASERFIRECRLLNPMSSAVCVAPSMISDAGMTTRRQDKEAVRKAETNNPKGRLLESKEVADLIFWLIKNPSTYITNTTIDINGGKFSRMLYK
jgi:NAD(P)-dependent dehydrogenase (short-subunit alcohol dehydrogenase family)